MNTRTTRPLTAGPDGAPAAPAPVPAEPGDPAAGAPEALRWWDIEQLAQLEDLLFPGDSPWTPAMFWSELAQGHHYVVCRGADGGVLGYAGLAEVDDYTEVQTIGVHPGAQRRGLGRALLTDLVAAADGRRILLDVRTDNTAAIRLYESFGFLRVGLRRRYYQPSGADAFTMERAATR